MYHFIVNPNSQSGKGEATWKKLEKILDVKNISYEVYMTTKPGDARKIATKIYSNLASENDAIIAMGGDGSMNDIIRDLPLENKPIVGFISSGSGNDFAKGMGLPENPEEALERIINSKETKTIDIGEVDYGNGNKRRFCVSAGIGYDACICYSLDHGHLKKIFNSLHIGKMAYTAIGLKEWLAYKKASGTLNYDGKELRFNNLSFMSVHNLPYEGGGWPFAKDANATDGELSICLMEPASKLTFFRAMLPCKNNPGNNEKYEGTYIINCKEAHLHVDTPLAVHTDGEAMKNISDVSYRVIPQALRLLV